MRCGTFGTSGSGPPQIDIQLGRPASDSCRSHRAGLALDNAIDNAIRHGSTAGWIRIAAFASSCLRCHRGGRRWRRDSEDELAAYGDVCQRPVCERMAAASGLRSSSGSPWITRECFSSRAASARDQIIAADSAVQA